MRYSKYVYYIAVPLLIFHLRSENLYILYIYIDVRDRPPQMREEGASKRKTVQEPYRSTCARRFCSTIFCRRCMYIYPRGHRGGVCSSDLKSHPTLLTSVKQILRNFCELCARGSSSSHPNTASKTFGRSRNPTRSVCALLKFLEKKTEKRVVNASCSLIVSPSGSSTGTLPDRSEPFRKKRATRTAL